MAAMSQHNTQAATLERSLRFMRRRTWPNGLGRDTTSWAAAGKYGGENRLRTTAGMNPAVPSDVGMNNCNYHGPLHPGSSNAQPPPKAIINPSPSSFARPSKYRGQVGLNSAFGNYQLPLQPALWNYRLAGDLYQRHQTGLVT
jgi:hypothetical protein